MRDDFIDTFVQLNEPTKARLLALLEGFRKKMEEHDKTDSTAIEWFKLEKAMTEVKKWISALNLELKVHGDFLTCAKCEKILTELHYELNGGFENITMTLICPKCENNIINNIDFEHDMTPLPVQRMFFPALEHIVKLINKNG